MARRERRSEAPHFTYTYDAGSDILSTIDGDCAAKYLDGRSSQSLYWRTAYARE